MTVFIYLGLALNLVFVLCAFFYSTQIAKAIKKTKPIAKSRNIDAEQLIQEMTRMYGLNGLTVAEPPLGAIDTYHPNEKTLYVSQASRHSREISVFAAVMHEVGHAVQHSLSDRAYRFSITLTRIVRSACLLALPCLVIALIVNRPALRDLCIWVFVFAGLCTPFLYTVDCKASQYALDFIRKSGRLQSCEIDALSGILRVMNWFYIRTVYEPFLMAAMILGSCFEALLRKIKSKERQ